MPEWVETGGRWAAARLVPAAMLASVTFSAEAASVQSVYSAGAWQVFSGIGDDQRAFCEISSGGAAGRRVLILQLAGDPNLTLQLIKDSWAIPAQTPVEVLFNIDGNTWPFHTTGSGQLVGMAMPPDSAADFARSFRAGRTMTVSFPGGTEAPWSGSLNSSNAVFNAFDRCRGIMLGQMTQPYAAPAGQPAPVGPTPAPASTQPFVAPAADPGTAPIAPPQGLPPIPSAPGG